jgi:hypothetical protein
MQEGLDLKQAELFGVKYLELGRNSICMEACNRVSTHALIDSKVVPIDLIAPFLCLRCSDVAYLVESHRNKNTNIPLFLIDHPVDQQNKPWAIELLAVRLRELANKISELSGKKINDEKIFNEIKIENRTRRLACEITELWWSSEILPINSMD